MITLDTLVRYTFFAVIATVVAALLWWAITYAEAQFPAPVAWKVVRLVFVLLCVFLCVAVLLSLLGRPVVVL